MYAHLNQPCTPYSAHSTFSNSESVSLSDVRNDKVFDLKSAPTTTETESGKADLTKTEDEVEDDELTTSRKHLAVKNYFTTTLFAQASRYFYQKERAVFPYAKNSPNPISCRYLAFCNFRI